MQSQLYSFVYNYACTCSITLLAEAQWHSWQRHNNPHTNCGFFCWITNLGVYKSWLSSNFLLPLPHPHQPPYRLAPPLLCSLVNIPLVRKWYCVLKMTVSRREELYRFHSFAFVWNHHPMPRSQSAFHSPVHCWWDSDHAHAVNMYNHILLLLSSF